MPETLQSIGKTERVLIIFYSSFARFLFLLFFRKRVIGHHGELSAVLRARDERRAVPHQEHWVHLLDATLREKVIIQRCPFVECIR